MADSFWKSLGSTLVETGAAHLQYVRLVNELRQLSPDDARARFTQYVQGLSGAARAGFAVTLTALANSERSGEAKRFIESLRTALVNANVPAPSASSALVGARTRNGLEFGVGPNLSVAGAALVATAGVTFRAGGLNIPVNLAVVPSKVSWVTYSGPPSFRSTEIERRALRVSLLFGFNTWR